MPIPGRSSAIRPAARVRLISAGSGSNKGCVTIGDVAANGRKNTIQADPSAASDPGSYVVKKAYVGDSDGRYWRFTFDRPRHYFRER